MLRVAAIAEDTCAEGPGRRWALWVQGCSLRCAGCCNPEMFDERRGEATAIEELAARISEAHAHGVEGVRFFTRNKVVTTRWLDPSHGGLNLGVPQND